MVYYNHFLDAADYNLFEQHFIGSAPVSGASRRASRYRSAHRIEINRRRREAYRARMRQQAADRSIRTANNRISRQNREARRRALALSFITSPPSALAMLNPGLETFSRAQANGQYTVQTTRSIIEIRRHFHNYQAMNAQQMSGVPLRIIGRSLDGIDNAGYAFHVPQTDQ